MRKPYAVVLAVAALGGLAYLALTARGGGDSDTTPDAEETRAPAGADAAPLAADPQPEPAPARERPTLPEPPALPDTPEQTELGPEGQAVVMVRLKDAHAAYRDGDYGKARAAAESILETMPRRNSARLVAAMSSCRLGDAKTAQAHADHLERSRFETVRLHCLDEGIALRNPYTTASDAGAGSLENGGGPAAD